MPKADLSRAAADFLRSLQRGNSKHAKQIARRIIALETDPLPPDSRQLVGHDRYRRVDTGEYRIVYLLDDDRLIIDVIGKRNDDEVYRRFGRRR